MSTAKTPWWLPLVLAGASLIVSAFVGYNHNDKELVQRVSVLEAHQEDTNPRLDRLESKIDNLTSYIVQHLK